MHIMFQYLMMYVDNQHWIFTCISHRAQYQAAVYNCCFADLRKPLDVPRNTDIPWELLPRPVNVGRKLVTRRTLGCDLRGPYVNIV